MAYHNNPRIVTDGLVLCLDANAKASYPGTGTTWYDLCHNYDFTLSNANLYTQASNGVYYMNFEGGIAKYLPGGTLTNVPNYANATICIWSTVKAADGDWKTLIRGAGGDHQVIVNSANGIDLGMYDNNGGGFNDSGFNVNTMSNHTTQFHFMAWKLSTSSPYYQFYYDDNTSSASGTITNANATFNNGFASVGAYHNANSTTTSFSQEWGKIGSFAYYNRHLSSSELLQNYNAHKTRYGL